MIRISVLFLYSEYLSTWVPGGGRQDGGETILKPTCLTYKQPSERNSFYPLPIEVSRIPKKRLTKGYKNISIAIDSS